MGNFTSLMRSARFEGGLLSAEPSEDWRQGRTIYGGLTAAFAFEAAIKAFPDLPALRSAQIAFVGPAEGAITAQPSILRRGKSVAAASVDLSGDQGLAARAIFAFGAPRASLFNARYLNAPPATAPNISRDFGEEEKRPAFVRQFDVRLVDGALPFSGAAAPDTLLWVRHRDAEATSLAALIALADMPPPAITPMFAQFAPISTLTWSFNILADNPQTEEGWWLLSSVAEAAGDGYTSQNMAIWNRAGEPILAGRQSVTVYL